MTTKTFQSAAIAVRADARDNTVMGFRRIRIAGADTGGRLGFFEEIVPQGMGVPLHVHEREDEMFNVRKGRFRIWCGDESFVISQGDMAVLPRGVPHRFLNIGETEGWLDVTVTPGGFETVFELAGQAGQGAVDRFLTIAPTYGLQLLPEPTEA
jgi:mannose-6-phosphate isomerase-like protein (cupin superfamily)